MVSGMLGFRLPLVQRVRVPHLPMMFLRPVPSHFDYGYRHECLFVGFTGGGCGYINSFAIVPQAIYDLADFGDDFRKPVHAIASSVSLKIIFSVITTSGKHYLFDWMVFARHFNLSSSVFFNRINLPIT